MKSYNNCPLKRSIQKVLWNGIKATNILGLSSPEFVANYIINLPNCKAMYLVNYFPNSELINTNSLAGLFDMLLNRNIHVDFIDADFCDSILSSGDDLMYVYNKSKKLGINVTISFTFSIRGVGLEKTLEWLKSHFPEINCDKNLLSNSFETQRRQFANIYGDCIHYRESGEQMLTGIIKIKKK